MIPFAFLKSGGSRGGVGTLRVIDVISIALQIGKSDIRFWLSRLCYTRNRTIIGMYVMCHGERMCRFSRGLARLVCPESSHHSQLQSESFVCRNPFRLGNVRVKRNRRIPLLPSQYHLGINFLICHDPRIHPLYKRWP